MVRCACVALACCAAIGAGLIAPGSANACGALKHAHAVHHARGHARAPLVIGDSTMIFAAPVLGHLGLEADAHGCRQFGQGVGILAARRHAHTLPPISVLALGANGSIGGQQIGAALRVIGPRRVLGLVTPRNSASSAGQMRRAARRHPDHVLLIDWAAFSVGHGAWFADDRLTRQRCRCKLVRETDTALCRSARLSAGGRAHLPGVPMPPNAAA